MSLSASYRNASGEPERISHDLGPSPLQDGGVLTAEKRTAYLAKMRESAVKLQAEVNTLLTKKMEEDVTAAGGRGEGRVDDQKEEENYGEENVDE